MLGRVMPPAWSRHAARKAVLALLLLALPPFAPARAGFPSNTPRHVEATLTADAAEIAPGGTVRVVLHQLIEPGWHTYWQNPGDSGLPTTIAWTLPPGLTADPIVWPVPDRFETGPLVNLGYHGRLDLPVTIHAAPDLKEGTRMALTAKADWLACSDICVPEATQLDLSLTVKSGAPLSRAAEPFGSATAALRVDADSVAITVPAALKDAAPADLTLFPDEAGVIDLAVRPKATAAADGTVVLVFARGEVRDTPPARLSGLLVALPEGQETPSAVLRLQASVGGMPALVAATLPSTSAATGEAAAGLGLAAALALAVLGGLVLNLMPCVFPVLSIKAVSLARASAQHPLAARCEGLAYTAGVLLSFAAIGGALLALRAGGAAIGWGFQLQSPLVVSATALLLFGAGLSLSGGLQLSAGKLANAGGELCTKPGLVGPFFTGVLATLVATPCTAPFMGAALGYALTAPAAAAMAVFEAVGLGLALPYLILAFMPAAARLLPKPGLWMERLKQVLAFPLYASAAWLVWVLAQQAGPDAVLASLAAMVLLALAGWLWSLRQGARPPIRVLHAAFAGLALGASLIAAALPRMEAPIGIAQAGTVEALGQDWEPFTPTKLASLREAGRPVFLNMTAAWCITCKVNERLALRTAQIAPLKQKGVAFLKGDWTRQDPAITTLLATYGRSGVPLYLVYRPGAEPALLPQILEPDTLADAFAGQ